VKKAPNFFPAIAQNGDLLLCPEKLLAKILEFKNKKWPKYRAHYLG
jgi:hypothetical protein